MSSLEQDNQNAGPGAGASDQPASSAPKADYQVGYKRPPLKTRFKPGQSGNPKGRPKGASNLRTTLNRVMNEKVSMREGDRVRRVNKFEAVLQAQANKGIKGDARSAGMVVNLMGKTGLLDGEAEPVKVKNSDAKVEQTIQPRPGDMLFFGLDLSLLGDDDKIALSNSAMVVDERGIGGLSTSQFECIKEIAARGSVTNRVAG